MILQEREGPKILAKKYKGMGVKSKGLHHRQKG